MTKDEYRTCLQQSWMLAQLLVGMPVEDMLRQIGTAEAVGPIIDPTMYRNKAEALHQDKRMLEAIADAKARLSKLGLRSIEQMAAAHAAAGMEGGAT